MLEYLDAAFLTGLRCWWVFEALRRRRSHAGALFQGFFESIFSAWPFSKLFELNGSVREWWFRWKLDRFVSSAPPPRPLRKPQRV